VLTWESTWSKDYPVVLVAWARLHVQYMLYKLFTGFLNEETLPPRAFPSSCYAV
jgi:hypothetical protein